MVATSVSERHSLRDLLAAHHYLGYRQPAGASLGYLVYGQDRPVACARFGPAAWKVAARDHFIGWTSEQRGVGLKRLVNHDRFLILPWVKAPDLASFLLGKVCQRLAADWWKVYQESIVLAETFVDSQRFKGTCYRAANWFCVGQSQGRGRNERAHEADQPFKSVWCYPWQKDFRQQLFQRRNVTPRTKFMFGLASSPLFSCSGTSEPDEKQPMEGRVVSSQRRAPHQGTFKHGQRRWYVPPSCTAMRRP